MTTSDVLKELTRVFYIMAALGIVISIVIFFALRITEAIKYLSGRLAKEQMELIRKGKNDGGRVGADEFFGGKDDFKIKVNPEPPNETGELVEPEPPNPTDILHEPEPVGPGFRIGSLQNQQQMGSVQNGTTILRSTTSNDSDFALIRNIVYINTSEYI